MKDWLEFIGILGGWAVTVIIGTILLALAISMPLGAGVLIGNLILMIV